MTALRPPFAYYGGKQRMAPKLLQLMPRHTVYVEPFCGGAALYWLKGMPVVGSNHDYREVLNDINGDITNFYRVMQDKSQAEELMYRLKWTPYSQDEYRKAQKHDGDEIEKAWCWIVNQAYGYLNKGYTTGFGTGINGGNLPAEWGTLKTYLGTNLELYLSRMSSTYITNEDALRCIKRWDSPQTLFYCDPPYVGADQGPYKGYMQDQLALLVYTLSECEGSFMLSGYENDAPEAAWQRHIFYTNASSANGKNGSGRGARIEHVWLMDRSAAATPELQPVMDRIITQWRPDFKQGAFSW